jgi:hypothetical protein
MTISNTQNYNACAATEPTSLRSFKQRHCTAPRALLDWLTDVSQQTRTILLYKIQVYTKKIHTLTLDQRAPHTPPLTSPNAKGNFEITKQAKTFVYFTHSVARRPLNPCHQQEFPDLPRPVTSPISCRLLRNGRSSVLSPTQGATKKTHNIHAPPPFH